MPAPIVAAGVGAGIAAGVSWLGARGQNKAARREARRDRTFQERMSSTQWQRGKADMIAAGINPALAYQQGGASSPSGAMAQQVNELGPAVSSAQEARRLDKELRLLDTQDNQVYMDARLKGSQATESAARTQLTYRQQKFQELQNELSELSLFSARNQANLEKTRFGQLAPYMERITGMAPRLNLGAVLGARRRTPTTQRR